MRIKDKAVYEYAASFPGVVPGLPQQLTGAEAKEMGVKELLKDALKVGTYRELPEEQSEEDKE